MVDPNISDLFFNLDFEHCHNEDDKIDEIFDWHKISREADWFLGSLSRLGVDVPTTPQLIQDFKNRI